MRNVDSVAVYLIFPQKRPMSSRTRVIIYGSAGVLFQVRHYDRLLSLQSSPKNSLCLIRNIEVLGYIPLRIMVEIRLVGRSMSGTQFRLVGLICVPCGIDRSCTFIRWCSTSSGYSSGTPIQQHQSESGKKWRVFVV